MYNWVYRVYKEYNHHLRYITGCLEYLRDEKLPSYMGIVMNHYKDPYSTTSISWKVRLDLEGEDIDGMDLGFGVWWPQTEN